MFLGIVGAVVGHWLFSALGASGVAGVNPYSLLVPVVGSVALLGVYHAVPKNSIVFRAAVAAAKVSDVLYSIRDKGRK